VTYWYFLIRERYCSMFLGSWTAVLHRRRSLHPVWTLHEFAHIPSDQARQNAESQDKANKKKDHDCHWWIKDTHKHINMTSLLLRHDSVCVLP